MRELHSSTSQTVHDSSGEITPPSPKTSLLGTILVGSEKEQEQHHKIKEEKESSSLPSVSSFPIKKTTSLNEVLFTDTELSVSCRNEIERCMLFLVASRNNIKIVIGLMFILATMQGLKHMTLLENVISIVLFVAQLFNNYYRDNFDMAMTYEDALRKMDGNERQRTIVSIIIFSIRITLLPQHKMTFLPILFIWFAGANKLYILSTFWGLFPSYYALFLYISCATYKGYYEFIENGYSSVFVDMISEYFILIGCVWMFTFYLVNVTSFLKQKVDKLQETRKRLESALEARSRFMAHISHEFRCPIMSSIGCLELLKETPLNEKQNDLVDTIVSSNSILLLLIEDILQTVKIEHENKKSKKQDLNVKNFNLYESLKSMKGIIVGYASNFKVNLHFDIDDNIKDMFVFSNASKLHQILSNLLTNAVKASNKDGEVWLKCQVLEQHSDLVRIRFTCQDFGCGIPQHLISSIFEPFVQLQNSSQSKVPSSGLGLTTVSHLIKSVDGTISVQSQVGKGSIFTVDLPFKIASVSTVVDQKIEMEDKRSKLHLNVHKNYLQMMTSLEKGEKETEEKEKFNSKIIVAEDNPINRKVIVKMINSLGFDTDYVCDGKELVDKFNPQTHKVVITDMNMPQMSGLEAARSLREKYGRSFNIYLLTGNVTISLGDMDEMKLIDGILTKPCSRQELNKCFEFIS